MVGIVKGLVLPPKGGQREARTDIVVPVPSQGKIVIPVKGDPRGDTLFNIVCEITGGAAQEDHQDLPPATRLRKVLPQRIGCRRQGCRTGMGGID